VTAKKLDWIKENDIPGFRRDKKQFDEYRINSKKENETG